MLERFYPTAYYDSAYNIDYDGLYKAGYKGIIYDVDNTLVEHGAPVTTRAIELFTSFIQKALRLVLSLIIKSIGLNLWLIKYIQSM